MPHRMTAQYTVGDVWAMHERGDLDLAPEFQRNSVWPQRAKAYFIDTLLQDRPVPLLIVERSASAQTGKSRLSVVDGQQRLRAIIEYLDGAFRLGVAEGGTEERGRFHELDPGEQERLLSYPLLVQVLEDYSAAEIRDIFIRLNKYVARLRPQELRHARAPGEFSRFVDQLGGLDFWSENRVFSPTQQARMRP